VDSDQPVDDVYEEFYMNEESDHGRVLGAENGFPFMPTMVYRTEKGTPYLKTPGVHLIARPDTNLNSVASFLAGFDSDLNFGDYLNDPTKIDAGAQLMKFAGQACYASFGMKRTKNDDAGKYFEHIKQSGHGSVFEHANYSLFVYGISRSLSHELVRHRAGVGVSQLSQRYVSGAVLRFVERPEYQNDEKLHARFLDRIDASAEEYEFVAERLLQRQTEGEQSLTAERKTDLRKKVQQTARSVLPNETETFVVLTGNGRAWRHMCEMRAHEAAETEIRTLFVRAFQCLKSASPILFADYDIIQLKDGTPALDTKYRKV
jgi:thymidylate synthase (FAD)